MINLQYAVEGNNTSLGNKLFQYSFARILAEKYNRQLNCLPIPGFPNVAPLAGISVSSTDSYVIDGHICDINDLPQDKSWHLRGYFQRYEYYKDHKEKIRSWLKPDVTPFDNPDAICIHYRLGDYVGLGYYIPPEHLIERISTVQDRQVCIVTDEVNHKFIRQIMVKCPNVTAISNQREIDDFKFIMSFNEIWISQSTFSWWAAWLSDAKRIVFPVPTKGYWSSERPDIDLWVDDEPRYIKAEVND